MISTEVRDYTSTDVQDAIVEAMHSSQPEMRVVSLCMSDILTREEGALIYTPDGQVFRVSIEKFAP